MSTQGHLLECDRLALYFADNVNIYAFPNQIYKRIYWTESFKKRFFEIIISYYKDFLQTTTPETDILCFLKQSFICIFYDV